MSKLPLRTALTIVALSSAVAGCALAGDRAGSPNGKCPAGETCSELTPNGLFFVGTASTDNIFKSGLATTARGGRQTVTALTGSGSGSPPYDGDFDAKTENPSVASVLSIDPPSVDLQGEVFGSTRLRLLEPGTDKLLDRVEVKVAEVAKVSLFPAEMMLISDDDKPWAMLAGSSVPQIVRLENLAGDRLVDEDLDLTAATGNVSRKSCDLFAIDAPAQGEASCAIKAGDGSFEATAKVVEKIDEVIGSDGLGNTDEPIAITVEQDSLVCFLARSGSLPVAGAEWEFALPPSVELGDLQLDFPLPSCVTLRGVSPGAAELTVKASGVSKVVKLDVGAKQSPLFRGPTQQRALKGQMTRVPVIGERARTEDEG